MPAQVFKWFMNNGMTTADGLAFRKSIEGFNDKALHAIHHIVNWEQLEKNYKPTPKFPVLKDRIINETNKVIQFFTDIGTKDTRVYPLADWEYTDKEDVNIHWESMPFRLQLESHEGNCQVCFKKSKRKLCLLAIEHPERFIPIKFYEDTYGTEHKMFRNRMTSTDIITMSEDYTAKDLRRLIGTETDTDGCSSSCEAGMEV